MISYISISLILGLWSLFCAFLFTRGVTRHYDWSRKLPRLVWPGMLLGSICLIWAAYHGCIMLEGELSRFHIWVKLLVPVTIVLSYFFLDFLTARAVGGFMILAANYLLHASFAQATLGRGFYAVICLLLGTSGLFLLGTPWRWRQILELTARQTPWRYILGALFALCAASLIIQPFFSAAP